MHPVDQAEGLIASGGSVHLMGAGGIGMAGVAWLLRGRGLSVTGCDLLQNRLTAWLGRQGIAVAAGHGESHVEGGADWLVRSTAVPESHPEVVRARRAGLPVLRRGEVLAALMRGRTCIAVCGTHGKTTTTAMVAQALGCGYCIGGEVPGFEGVARDAPLMVVEADESDGTLAGYAPDYTVITNIEFDHMEHFESEAAFVGCFGRIVENTRARVWYRAGDALAEGLCAGKAKCAPFALPAVPFALPVPGLHNQWNAAAALAVGRCWKGEAEILDALRRFRPVRRRFETVRDRGGVRVVSDYAHHPTEIAALVRAALELRPRRLLAVFQPHRFSRTLALGPDFPAGFEGVDKLWLVPVYAASEPPLAGGASLDLLARFPAAWGGRLAYCETLEAAWDAIRRELREGDLLLIIGAGDIDRIAGWAREP